MKVAGFTFIRNAVQFDYPIVEAITSILPICDEFVVAVGNSTDETLQLIQAIGSDKIRIIHTIWDDHLREGGKVLALETNKAFQAISPDADWAFYIQGDEVVHEKYLDTIRQEMQRWLHEPEVEGLLFKYLHFYGSYQYIGDSRKWYRREIRIIRNNKCITSYRDAQGFRKKDNTKLHVKLIDAYIYHYGWVKEPLKQQQKQRTFHKYWHDDAWMQKNIPAVDVYDYSNIDSLVRFDGSHPAVMQERIAREYWQLNIDINRKKYSSKDKLLMWVEKHIKWRIGEYKNYKIV
jgi:glycosyltransferase involved in cell wall biosynthesis